MVLSSAVMPHHCRNGASGMAEQPAVTAAQPVRVLQWATSWPASKPYGMLSRGLDGREVFSWGVSWGARVPNELFGSEDTCGVYVPGVVEVLCYIPRSPPNIKWEPHYERKTGSTTHSAAASLHQVLPLHHALGQLLR
jgi:hypothetical protein